MIIQRDDMKVYAVVYKYDNGKENILDLYKFESDAEDECNKQKSDSIDCWETFYVKEMKVL